MADTNGVSEESSVKIEVKEDKVDTNCESKDSPVKTEIKEEKTDNAGAEDKQADGEKKPAEESKSQLSPEILAKKIKRQIEYYFGDYNLPTDKFLRSAVKEKDGWIPIETLLKFNRLAALTDQSEVIVNALQGSQLIQISEDKTELRRNPDKPLPEESEARRKEILTRSVYVKGFPQEGFTMDSALDFFDQFGPTDDVVMRFWQDKAEKTWKFKGSVFIKFPTKEAAQAFLDLEEVKYEDTPLIKMWQEDYIEKKRKERLDQKMLKRKHPEGQQENKGSKRQKFEEDKGLPKDATLHMTKCPEGLTREFLKEKLEGFGVTVAFIDFNKGDEEGWIRLHEEGTAAKVIAKCEDGVLKLKEGLEVTLRRLEGEEEATFLETAKQNISARRAKGNQQGRQRGGHRGGRRGGRGGRGGGNWRKRKHEDSEETQSKHSRLDDSGDEGD